jgi:outer membrane beta-barrel protein
MRSALFGEDQRARRLTAEEDAGSPGLRWMGGGVSRFDFNAVLGAGVTDDSTSQGLTGSFGFGTKWYFGKWFALRLDVRDHILRETLIGEEHLVNDILVTGGFSIFIPFGG